MRYFFEIIWMVVIGVGGRLLPHPPNVTPLVGLSLFAVVKLPRWVGFVTMFFTLFVSDLLLAIIFGYPAIGYFTLFTYTGFMGITLVGFKLKAKSSNRSFIFFVLTASFSFWLWTNFGVWLTSGLYPKTMKGLGFCYYMALPFLRNGLIGDLAWSTVIFGLARVAEFGRRAGFRFQWGNL